MDRYAPDPEMGKWIYYRVTGEDPAAAFASRWNRGRRGLSWDSIMGGEKVGGMLEGLSLRGSAYETTLGEFSRGRGVRQRRRMRWGRCDIL